MAAEPLTGAKLIRERHHGRGITLPLTETSEPRTTMLRLLYLRERIMMTFRLTRLGRMNLVSACALIPCSLILFPNDITPSLAQRGIPRGSSWSFTGRTPFAQPMPVVF